MTQRSHFWALWLVPLVSIGLTLGACGPEDGTSVAPDPPEYSDPLPFSADSDSLLIKRDGEWEPLFLAGVNLGVGLPGTRAGHLAATREQYAQWFRQMSDAGINALRVYTLHYPRFYEELARHNEERPDRPIYVLHGVWLHEENPSGDLFDMTDVFDMDIEEVVDCVHGFCSIGHRFGRAYGDFEADISPWVIGWIIGREVSPDEVLITDGAHPNQTSFEGRHLGVFDTNPTTVWFTQRLDYLIEYERSVFGVERPVSASSWPTLDPLSHPTEGSRYSSEDVAQFELHKLQRLDAPGGVFATYHAYPYYPDFIPDDPDYRQNADEEGPNSYLGYLIDLKTTYDTMPLFIGEFGVPSSWGNAHFGWKDMNHGGHTEVEQGLVAARLLRTIHAAGTGGGALFAWIDEWWKPTWITDQRDFPRERHQYWHNVTAPEQNFGLIAFDLPAPDFASAPSIDGTLGIKRVTAVPDAAFFHVEVQLEEPFDANDSLVIGLDTYADDLGEKQLPDGTTSPHRNEFAVVIDGHQQGRMMVTPAYNLARIWHGTPGPEQKYRSVASDSGDWVQTRWLNSQEHGDNEGNYFFEEMWDEEIGVLKLRLADEEATSRDAIVVDGRRIRVRIPWTLLNVSDPSKRLVIHDDLSTPGRETRLTQGIALTVSLNGEVGAATRRYGWDTWDEAPVYIERTKPALQLYGDAIRELSEGEGPSLNSQ